MMKLLLEVGCLMIGATIFKTILHRVTGFQEPYRGTLQWWFYDVPAMVFGFILAKLIS